ncbi:MAG: enoyl-CoA hydratase-related protein [Bacteriovorax sp.]|nr:enoyl-CoA hydratase-related protein [Bacteriovorax sp.]
MKALTRVPIFSYNTIATTLLIPTKSLEIKFRKTYLTSETLFELESVLAWAATHTEVHSLFLTSFGNDFIQGFDPAEIKTLTEEKLKKQFNKISTIAQSLLCLPQTVVVDMKNGTRGVGLELSLAADIRLAKSTALFCFDHLFLGLTPNCGMFSFLKPFLNQNVLRSLILSGLEFNKDSFMALGGWCEFDKEASVILANIFAQAPIARMQAKRGLYGIDQAINQEHLEIEKKLFNAVVHSLDYTKDTDFMNLSEFKDKVAETRN